MQYFLFIHPLIIETCLISHRNLPNFYKKVANFIKIVNENKLPQQLRQLPSQL